MEKLYFVQNKIVKIGIRTCLTNMPFKSKNNYQNNGKPNKALSIWPNFVPTRQPGNTGSTMNQTKKQGLTQK